MSLKIFLLTGVILLTASFIAHATHLKGGYIEIKRTTGLSCQITIVAYTNLNSQVNFGTGTLDFGDGSAPLKTELTSAQTLDEQLRIGIVRYVVNHTFAVPGFYMVTYREHNLNLSIVNIDNSVNTIFSLNSGIRIGSDFASVPTITFSTQPVFSFDSQQNISYALAVDDATHFYSYAMTNPYGDNYTVPPSCAVNEKTGLLEWDGKFHSQYYNGEYLFVVRITQFDENGLLLGWVERNIDFVVDDSNSDIHVFNPLKDSSNRILLPANAQRTLKFILQDVGDTVKLRWTMVPSDLLAGSVALTQYDSVSDNHRLRVGLVKLNTKPNIVREEPYVISLHGTSSLFTTHGSSDVSFLYYTKEYPKVVTGIREDPRSGLAWPNPFRNHLSLGDDLTGTAFKLYTTQGVVAMIGTVHGVLDTSALSSGLYILELRSERGVERVKVVKN